MNKKQKMLVFALSGSIGVLTIFSASLLQEYQNLQTRYKTLYEMAAYLAGRVEGAGLDVEEFDLLALRSMAPNKPGEDPFTVSR